MTDTEVGKCSKCETLVYASFVGSYCQKCGEVLPYELEARQRQIVEGAGGMAAAHDLTRSRGIVAVVVGILLLIFGAMRWNSMASQLARAFGQTDGLSVLFFLGGAAALALGMYLLSPTSGTATSRGVVQVMKSAEGRIRELDDLRSKDLITEAEHAERKKDILASL